MSTSSSSSGQGRLRFEAAPGGVLRGRLRVPGDKSVSHRAVMLAALADGVTEISGFLEGADSLATLAAFRAMGVTAEGPVAGRLVIHGVGIDGLRAPSGPLDLGNSGTSMRLLAGLLSGQRFTTTLIGDASLTRRPMRRVTTPLALMGAQIATSPDGTAPLTIRPANDPPSDLPNDPPNDPPNPGLHGIDYRLPVASAQVKSSLLLAGLYARGETSVTEPAPTRDHTERMLTAFGWPVQRTPLADPADDRADDGVTRIALTGGGRLRAAPIAVPADISSAAFFLVGGSLSAAGAPAGGEALVLEAVGINPTRIGVINILRAMGADIRLAHERLAGGEPVADLVVRPAPLRGIRIPEDQVPLAIDEFPALFIAAACAEGETLLTGAEELRVKESDRIAVMATGLTTLGVAVEPRADGIRIQGLGPQGRLRGGRIDSHGDHRIAMAFAIAALRADAPILIDDCDNVDTSFPGFATLAAAAGLNLHATRQ